MEDYLMKRRDFIGKAGIGLASGVAAASTLSTPALAQSKKTITIVSTWPRDFPGLGISAQRLAARITELSKGFSYFIETPPLQPMGAQISSKT